MTTLAQATAPAVRRGWLPSPSSSTYPRIGEPIVPQLLLPHLDDPGLTAAARLDPGDQDAAACRALAAQVLGRVESLLRDRWPHPWAARIQLPNPSALVHAVPIEGRTYTLLRRRTDGVAQDGPWTVAQYLEIKGFGARALVDVLCAWQAQSSPLARPLRHPSDRPNPLTIVSLPLELSWIDQWHRRRCNSRGPDRPVGDDPRTRGTPLLDRALTLIAAALPLSSAAAQRLLRDDEPAAAQGATSAQVSPDELSAAAVRLGRPAPFRRIRGGDADLLVRWCDVDAARAVHNIAVRMTFDWGIPQIGAVADRLAVLHGLRRDPSFIEQVLRAHPDFGWLDRADGWFWLRRRSSRLHDDLAKIFSVTTEVSLRILRTLLFRHRPTPQRPTLTALATALDELPGIAVTCDRVTVPARLDAQIHLSRTERDLVPIFAQDGLVVPAHALRRMGHWGSSSWQEIDRVVRTSPLFQRSLAGYQLVGAAAI
jgi:hypothetical protein